MKGVLTPRIDPNATACVLAALGASALVAAIVMGPGLGPPGLDVIRHTTSQQAGQGMPGAWAMRTGFALYGLGVGLAVLLSRRPSAFERAGLAVFALGLIGAAVWSNAPPIPGLPADLAEDARHSLAASLVGLGFAGACAARLFAPPGALRDGWAWAGLTISVAIPLAMVAWPAWQGLLQRPMFLFSVAYVLRAMGPARG